jgi:hypothetical protein
MAANLAWQNKLSGHFGLIEKMALIGSQIADG